MYVVLVFVYDETELGDKWFMCMLISRPVKCMGNAYRLCLGC